MSRLACSIGALLAALLAPTAAFALDGADVIGDLSAQRVYNGLAPLQLSPAFSAGCAAHDAYIWLNGGYPVHDETPGAPGYTGSVADAQTAEVLAVGRLNAWDTHFASPWTSSPVHLLEMFAPDAGSAGFAAVDGVDCLRLDAKGTPPAGPASVPGNGTAGVPTSIDASIEVPYSPADLFGVSNTTGFNILLYRTGGSYDVRHARLSGPKGGVRIGVMDSRTDVPGGGTFKPWNGAIIVPFAKLASNAAYTLDVTFVDGTQYHAGFSTAPVDVAANADLTVTPSYRAPYLLAGVRSSGPAATRLIRVTGPDGSVHAPDASGRVAVALPGRYSVCARVGGGRSGVPAAARCASISVSAVSERLQLARRAGGRLTIRAGASAKARRAQVRMYDASGHQLRRVNVTLGAAATVLQLAPSTRRVSVQAPAKRGYRKLNVVQKLV